MIHNSAGLGARLFAARADALAGEDFQELRMRGNILINVTIRFSLTRLYFKKAVESDVDPHRDTSGNGVRNFVTRCSSPPVILRITRLFHSGRALECVDRYYIFQLQVSPHVKITPTQVWRTMQP
jgi:hypothetical protein